jgi:hypothetical protein
LISSRQDVFLSDKKNLAPPGDLSKLRNSFFFMADLKKLQGRPKLKIGKRVRKLDVRFTEEEYKLILAMETEFGISKTELLRMRVLNDAQKIVVNGSELLKGLDHAGAELGRSGNNINQLAKRANTLKLTGTVPPQVIVHFNLLMEEYIRNQRALEISLRKIIRLMGK